MTDWSTSSRRARPSPSTCSADLNDGPVLDAVRVRVTEIGEAVRDVSHELLAWQPSFPWTVGADLVELLAATGSLLAVLDAHE